MSISHYLSVTSITERKYLNRYAKRKEYIKEHGEEPPQSLLDDLSDSPDTCFCRETVSYTHLTLPTKLEV